MKLILLVFINAIIAYAQSNISSPTPVKDTAVSGSTKGIIACDKSTFTSPTTPITSQLVALTVGKTIYVCALIINGGGTGTIKIESTSAAACGGITTQITPTFNYGLNSVISIGSGLGILFNSEVGNSLCITTSSGGTVNVFISYTVF